MKTHQLSESMGPGKPDPSAAQPLADVWLVRRAVEGDTHAFEMLVIKYQRRVERLIARWVRDVDSVPDIAQDTFINAYRALAQFRGDSQFYTWLYRIAVNTAKKHLLSQKNDPLVFESSITPGDNDEETFSPFQTHREQARVGASPEAELAAKEMAQVLAQALDELPTDFRLAITLREMEGLSYEAIAQALDYPVGTVRSRIFRAREALSRRIKPMLEHQGGKRW